MSVVITIENIEGFYDKWMKVTTTDGKTIGGKSGYLRNLLDIVEEEFDERPEIEGLKIRIMSETDALTEAIFFRGVWIKDKIMQNNWNMK